MGFAVDPKGIDPSAKKVIQDVKAEWAEQDRNQSHNVLDDPIIQRVGNNLGALTMWGLGQLTGNKSYVDTSLQWMSDYGDANQGLAIAVTLAGGRLVRNGGLAGGEHPETGIPFKENGYPDFSSVSTAEVKITQTGTRAGDFRAANQAAGLKRTPEGYSWHHHEDGTTMQLVPTDIHAQTGHTGGFQPGP